MDRALLLHAYDGHLRTAAEVRGAASVMRRGPLWLAAFSGGRGFVTYRDVGGADAGEVFRLVASVRDHFEADSSIRFAEWKTRGHDHAPVLHDALVEHGFVPGAPESIMLGEAQALAVDVAVPEGVVLRQVRGEQDVRAMSAMQDRVFGAEVSEGRANELLNRLELADGLELWVAEVEGEIVAAGRMEPVEGTPFAGLWGGATLEGWRGQGIYRALTAARARAALALGKSLLHSDSTEFSRPILERSGLIRASTTTPYVWSRY
jgi:hypothetical protein